MEFRIGAISRILPGRTTASSLESKVVATKEASVSSPRLRNSLRRNDPELSGPLSTAITLHSTYSEPKAQKTHLLTETFNEDKAEVPLGEPNRIDLENLRGAVVAVSEEFFRDDPSASLDDLKSRLDSVFGDGFSDLVKPRRVDQFNGKSEIHFEEFTYSKLNRPDQERIQKAVNVAEKNFSFDKTIASRNDVDTFSKTQFTYESNRYALYTPDDDSQS